jgi:hypothetical protein
MEVATYILMALHDPSGPCIRLGLWGAGSVRSDLMPLYSKYGRSVDLIEAAASDLFSPEIKYNNPNWSSG